MKPWNKITKITRPFRTSRVPCTIRNAPFDVFLSPKMAKTRGAVLANAGSKMPANIHTAARNNFPMTYTRSRPTSYHWTGGKEAENERCEEKTDWQKLSNFHFSNIIIIIIMSSIVSTLSMLLDSGFSFHGCVFFSIQLSLPRTLYRVDDYYGTVNDARKRLHLYPIS